MQKHIFRTYDIRGIVNKELFISDVKSCAKAFAYYIYQKDPTVTTIAVGMDGRIHSEAIKNEWIEGLLESGFSVIFIGPCTTPLLAYAQTILSVGAACMITASHNSKEYNGMKLFLHNQSVFDQELQKIKYFFLKKIFCVNRPQGEYKEKNILSDYVFYLKSLFPTLYSNTISVIFDCGNGAVGYVLRDVLDSLQLKNSIILYENVDGTYPHHLADPSVEKNLLDLQAVVLQNNAAVGIAFDGDGDRMGAVTSLGKMISGDRLLALFAESVIKKHPDKNISIVGDAKCSLAVKEYITQQGGTFIESRSGHAFIKTTMQKSNALVGGELSCHFFFKDKFFGSDDGLYAALRLLEIIIEEQQQLDQLLQRIPVYFSCAEIRIPLGSLLSTTVLLETREYLGRLTDYFFCFNDGIKIYNENGWALFRLSQTEPIFSFRCESKTDKGFIDLQDIFINLLKKWYNKEYIETLMKEKFNR